jgi:hypothetical protein
LHTEDQELVNEVAYEAVMQIAFEDNLLQKALEVGITQLKIVRGTVPDGAMLLNPKR